MRFGSRAFNFFLDEEIKFHFKYWDSICHVLRLTDIKFKRVVRGYLESANETLEEIWGLGCFVYWN